MTRMTVVEAQASTIVASVTELDERLRLVLSGLTTMVKAVQAATTMMAQTARACQELRTTAESLLKSQECVTRVINNIDIRVEGIGIRLTAL